MWRTTRRVGIEVRREVISIHVLRVEDDAPSSQTSFCTRISIHVLRVEDDHAVDGYTCDLCKFQSTSSVWRTTEVDEAKDRMLEISIHVLRVEDDGR